MLSKGGAVWGWGVVVSMSGGSAVQGSGGAVGVGGP